MEKIKAAPAAAEYGFQFVSQQNDSTNTSIKPKLIAFLETLLDRGTQGLNTFEAHSLLNDTCAHTTVSNINKKYGIRLDRRYETYVNRNGRKTRLCRYWIGPTDLSKVEKIIREYYLHHGTLGKEVRHGH